MLFSVRNSSTDPDQQDLAPLAVTLGALAHLVSSAARRGRKSAIKVRGGRARARTAARDARGRFLPSL